LKIIQLRRVRKEIASAPAGHFDNRTRSTFRLAANMQFVIDLLLRFMAKQVIMGHLYEQKFRPFFKPAREVFS
jgi:hypothetical protein